jgi:2-alkyl-3-oxoalkanoate reductase
VTGETSGGRFRGVRAAVTGAGGFIGAAVAAALAREGASVAGLDLRLPEPAAPGVEPVGADVSDPAALAPALDGAELVVHTAARVDEGRDMDDFVRVNVRGTANVLDAARGARVVHLSSVAVFGYEFPGEIDDDAPLRARRSEAAFVSMYGMPLARSGASSSISPGNS